MDALPTASVIIVGYNSARWLPACLASMTKQQYPGQFELIFVDNQSSDDSVPLVRRQCPGVRIIESQGNRGYAGGNNLGAQYAAGEVLAFVNPDTVAEPTWLAELVRPLVTDSTTGMTTSKIVLMDQAAVINTCGNDISLSGITTCHHAGERSSTVASDEDVPAVSGAACAIRSNLFRQLGGFDEQFWMYLEDTDLSWRVRLRGYRCVLAARSVIAHDYTFKLTPAKTKLIERNRYLMLAKNLGFRSLIALLPGLIAGEFLTWGWALMHGRRHLWAKLWAILWVIGHALEVWYLRREAQSIRRSADVVVLRRFQSAPAITAVSAGFIGRMADLLLTPVLVSLGAVGLSLISVATADAQPDSPMAVESLRDFGSGD